MAKGTNALKGRQGEFALLQGGKLPEGAVRRHLAGLKQKLAAETKEKLAIRQQAAKYLNDVQPPAGDGRGAKITQAENGLRAITERLAKQKLPAPRKLIRPPIPVWRTYTLNFTPFYSGLGTYSVGQISSVTGDPISASGVDDLGQMTCTVETNYDSPSSGTASNLLGVYFRPLFGPATVQISFDSQIAFWWYVNSIRNKLSIAEAQGLIQLYQYDGAFLQPARRQGAFLGFSVDGYNSLDFDVVSETGPTWYLEAPVSSENFYFVVISLTCTASGFGWPGSLAGVNAMVTVPSITVTITADEIAVP
jgi:hypothetical protein